MTGKAVDSDHYTQYLDMNIDVIKEKPEKQEVFNFKNKKSQEVFKTITSETNEFNDCFKDESNLLTKIEKWRKKKIRISNKKLKPLDKKISSLISRRNTSSKLTQYTSSE